MNQFKDEIYHKFKNKYEKINYKQETKDSYDKFYETVISELNITENKNFSKNVLLVKIIRPTKRRWIKIIINDENSLFNEEIKSAQIQYDKVKRGEMEIEKFESFFGASNLDNYKKIHLKELNKWLKDDNSFLTDFKYLDGLINRSVITAIKNDIYLAYFLFCEKEKVSITKVPQILSELPIDTSGKIDYLTETQKNDLDETSYIDRIHTLDKLISLEGEEKEEILMKLEKNTYLQIKNGGNPDKFLDMMTQVALLKSIKYLNSFDTKVINYYFNHFVNVIKGTPIDKTLYEIREELGLPNTTFYYNEIENSLAKIGSLNMTYNMEGNKLYGNLLSCMIYEENGAKKAKVYLGPILQELVLKDGAFEYDKDIYNKLSNMSQQLAVWLQKRRYTSALKNESNIDRIPIKSFSNAVYFKTKRMDRIRTRVIESLEEMKFNNLIIKDYGYNKILGIIEIEYLNLTIKERKKLGILDDETLVKPNNINQIE
ncbi:hypothetical protein FDA33_10240 [Clostridium botulinum]|uniref:Uncharacterized protein n=1 Tax=Clostridium botulinum TaxID=1491 RepID=A0A126JI87_CLOBO|nr:hypothetical protein [Clostridium botulinum]ALT05382.1 hypothetical protein [Clostridium botulinum]NFH90569.1 hypothetical protein [Clostridium botulinum]NFI18857.1 hypothetical protein [Clostridium botulinum]NFN53562.1 hypothetical protein [Clostridium botulinum]